MSGRPQPLLLPDGSPAAGAWTLDPGVLHLNHGSYGAVPRVALRHQAELRQEMERDPVRWFAFLAERIRGERQAMASLLGASPGAAAFVTNASAGASTVFRAMLARPAGDVIVTDHGYGAVVMGAARLARSWGSALLCAEIPLNASADVVAARVIERVHPGTGLVVIDQITSATAKTFPLAAILRHCAALDVPVLVDGAHSPAVWDDPVVTGHGVFWVGNLHKFACAPRGAAMIVADPASSADLFPTIDSWGAPEPFPERFDEQGTADASALLAARSSWSFVAESWGWDRVRDHVAELLAYGVARIAGALSDGTGEDHTVDTGTPAPHLGLVRLPGSLAATPALAHELRDRLLLEHDVSTAPTCFGGQGYLRLSPHAYSVAEEFDEFSDRIVPELLRWAGVGASAH